jgi:pilus assembly protein Flp/PilA
MQNQGFQGGFGMNMLERATDFFRDEEGASVVEYGVLIALIIAVCIAAIFAFGIKVEGTYNGFAQKYDNTVK